VDSGFLEGPIPGMSLTTEPGNRPWENPPMIVDVDKAIDYYRERLLNKENHDSILDILERGVPVRTFANILQTGAVMKNIHTLDVGFLVMPVIEELTMLVADAYDVEYTISREDSVRKIGVTPRQARLAVQEANKRIKAVEESPVMEEGQPAMRGLMARKESVSEEE
jgi:hypothetical protein